MRTWWPLTPASRMGENWTHAYTSDGHSKDPPPCRSAARGGRPLAQATRRAMTDDDDGSEVDLEFNEEEEEEEEVSRCGNRRRRGRLAL